jgi:hypothetical protein
VLENSNAWVHLSLWIRLHFVQTASRDREDGGSRLKCSVSRKTGVPFPALDQACWGY